MSGEATVCLADQGGGYVLRPWSDGYRIFENGELISTFHGPEYERAKRHFNRLREAASVAFDNINAARDGLGRS